MKTSELIELGLEKQAEKLINALRLNHERKQHLLAASFSAIPGVVVNSSFFDLQHKTDFDEVEIRLALLDLGIVYDKMQGKRWFEFWKGDSEVRLLNAIKLIKI